jgi:multidrug efflux pump subunit AcrA (membrane-fusion protein)
MQKPGKMMTFIRNQPLWKKIASTAVLVVLAGWWGLPWGGRTAARELTFVARRGPLDINVLEGGSLQAQESQRVKCEVRVGYQGTKILRMVEEGYLVTGEDVKNEKVLVELDSSELEKQTAQQDVEYQQTVANLIDAQRAFEIQLNQNQIDIQAAEQKARFARLDFDKFLGDTLTARIIKEHGLEKILTEAVTNNAEGIAPDLEVIESNATVFVKVAIDFSKYAREDMLGDGEAKQKMRKFEDDLQAAQKELGQAKATLDGTRRLFEKQFVAKTELVRDQLAQDSAELKVQTAETARALFLKYDFSKTAEQSLTDFTTSLRQLDSTRRVAVSKLAQARAKLRAAQGRYEVQSQQREDLNEQLRKCTIKATQPGLVVYGSGGNDGNQDPIHEGATVRERQTIITIPDLTQMEVKVKIHESFINKIKVGQKARITVDAFPDIVLDGEVSRMGVLPDSQNRWLNPDMMVYLTTIAIHGTYGWVKPGMSAKVEILVNHLNDVVYVPVQAVSPDNGKLICYVAGLFKPERREVEAGEFNDEFIEIKKGIKEGECVLLQAPADVEPETPDTDSPAVTPKPDETATTATP